jgi:transposase-like protein
VQLRHECPLSGETYVARKAWRDASLAACPRHPRGGCGLVRHGTYGRRTPVGMRIARYYCPTAHETFSLLPDGLASHFPGALDPIEQVVATVEAARSVEAAADVLRPDITLPSAVRWVRRRLTPVRCALVAVITYHMAALTREELAGYLTHRLRLASAEVPLFDPSAAEAIYQATAGLPRKINLLAHHTLLAAALTRAKLATADHVQAALPEIA